MSTLWRLLSVRAEASILTVEGLQLSSFIFTVPKNRPLSGPMIWQEWSLGPESEICCELIGPFMGNLCGRV